MISTMHDATQTLYADQYLASHVRWRGLHDPEKEKAHDGELLLESYAECRDRYHRKSQDSDVDQEVGCNCAEKELVTVDMADRVCDSLVPNCLCGNATENQHESAEDPPCC